MISLLAAAGREKFRRDLTRLLSPRASVARIRESFPPGGCYFRRSSDFKNATSPRMWITRRTPCGISVLSFVRVPKLKKKRKEKEEGEGTKGRRNKGRFNEDEEGSVCKVRVFPCE